MSEAVELELVTTEATENEAAVVGPKAPEPMSKDIVAPSGKVTGKRYSFHEGMRVSDLRRHLREQGLKGKALTAKVNETLRDEGSLKRMQARLLFDSELEKGKVPDYADLRDNGNSVFRLVQIKDPKPSATKGPSKAEKELAEKEEEIAGLNARLMELEAQLVAKKPAKRTPKKAAKKAA